MSTPQSQPTAEKSVQTQDLSGSTTLIVANNPVTHIHTENTTAEVANTLVSMASGKQRTATMKQLSVINVPTQSNLPILSLADYTTSLGVPTAVALATQAKLTPTKANDVIVNEDDTSMSTDEQNSMSNDPKSRTKSNRRTNKGTSRHEKNSSVEVVQYGPIVVKPRKTIAPTLANGRKSKDEPLPPDEDLKRKQRRDRNKEAAAKCRRKRNDLREQLEQEEKRLLSESNSLREIVENLSSRRDQLDQLLQRHSCVKKARISITPNNSITITKNDLKSIPTTTLLDPNSSTTTGKRVTINFTNPQDLLAVAPLTRISPTLTTNEGSSTVPMITIHIIPEVAQAIFGSSSVDKAKLAELLQQSNTTNATIATLTNSTTTNTTTNSTS